MSAIETTVHENFLTVAFSNGRDITVILEELTPEIRSQALLHGLKQKLVDAGALSRNPDTGRAASIEDKYNAIKEVYDRLMAGQWNKGRDGTTVAAGGLLFRALCILYPTKAPEALRAFLASKTPAEKAALRGTAKIAAIIDTLRVGEGDTDVDNMLAELK